MNKEEDLLEDIKGLVIVDGTSGEDGIHLELSDGRYLVITGYFAVGVCSVGEIIH